MNAVSCSSVKRRIIGEAWARIQLTNASRIAESLGIGAAGRSDLRSDRAAANNAPVFGVALVVVDTFAHASAAAMREGRMSPEPVDPHQAF